MIENLDMLFDDEGVDYIFEIKVSSMMFNKILSMSPEELDLLPDENQRDILLNLGGTVFRTIRGIEDAP